MGIGTLRRHYSENQPSKPEPKQPAAPAIEPATRAPEPVAEPPKQQEEKKQKAKK